MDFCLTYKHDWLKQPFETIKRDGKGGRGKEINKNTATGVRQIYPIRYK